MKRQAEPEPQYPDGGFGDSLRSQMSESLLRQLALDDAREQREIAQAEREREHRADLARERAIEFLVRQATERGDQVTMQQRMTGEGLGRTPAEFIAERAAIMDMEDQRAAARQRAEFNKWQLQQSADSSHDSSDIQAESVRWKEHHAEWGPKVAEQRARRRDAAAVVRADRRLREMGYKGV